MPNQQQPFGNDAVPAPAVSPRRDELELKEEDKKRGKEKGNKRNKKFTQSGKPRTGYSGLLTNLFYPHEYHQVEKSSKSKSKQQRKGEKNDNKNSAQQQQQQNTVTMMAAPSLSSATAATQQRSYPYSSRSTPAISTASSSSSSSTGQPVTRAASSSAAATSVGGGVVVPPMIQDEGGGGGGDAKQHSEPYYFPPTADNKDDTNDDDNGVVAVARSSQNRSETHSDDDDNSKQNNASASASASSPPSSPPRSSSSCSSCLQKCHRPFKRIAAFIQTRPVQIFFIVLLVLDICIIVTEIIIMTHTQCFVEPEHTLVLPTPPTPPSPPPPPSPTSSSRMSPHWSTSSGDQEGEGIDDEERAEVREEEKEKEAAAAEVAMTREPPHERLAAATATTATASTDNTKAAASGGNNDGHNKVCDGLNFINYGKVKDYPGYDEDTYHGHHSAKATYVYSWVFLPTNATNASTASSSGGGGHRGSISSHDQHHDGLFTTYLAPPPPPPVVALEAITTTSPGASTTGTSTTTTTISTTGSTRAASNTTTNDDDTTATNHSDAAATTPPPPSCLFTVANALPHNLHVAETVLKYIGRGIVMLFGVELLLLLIGLGWPRFCRNPLYMLDLFVVTITLVLEWTFGDNDPEITLVIILRLWRFARIIHGVGITIHEYEEIELHHETCPEGIHTGKVIGIAGFVDGDGFDGGGGGGGRLVIPPSGGLPGDGGGGFVEVGDVDGSDAGGSGGNRNKKQKRTGKKWKSSSSTSRFDLSSRTAGRRKSQLNVVAHLSAYDDGHMSFFRLPSGMAEDYASADHDKGAADTNNDEREEEKQQGLSSGSRRNSANLSRMNTAGSSIDGNDVDVTNAVAAVASADAKPRHVKRVRYKLIRIPDIDSDWR